jgi:hypothetical protein
MRTEFDSEFGPVAGSCVQGTKYSGSIIYERPWDTQERFWRYQYGDKKIKFEDNIKGDLHEKKRC